MRPPLAFDIAVGGLGLGQAARQRRRGIHLELGVVQAAGGRRAHLDGQESGVADAGRKEEPPNLACSAMALTKLATAIRAIQRRWCSAQAMTRCRSASAWWSNQTLKRASKRLMPRLGGMVVSRRVAPVGRQHGVEREADEQRSP
jgi:hypothetical protein